MGCDIHCYAEYRRATARNRWDSFGRRVDPGRDYHLFGALAGVRGELEPVVAPRGFPADAGYWARWDNYLWISGSAGDHSVTPERAAEYVARYGCIYDPPNANEPQLVSHPDWHTHSWITPDEFAAALERAEATSLWAPEYFALLAALRAFEGVGFDARLVFWFDN